AAGFGFGVGLEALPISGGGAVALNDEGGSVQALIVSSTVHAAGALDVEAMACGMIDAHAAGLGGAATVSVVGAAAAVDGARARNKVHRIVSAQILATRAGATAAASHDVRAGGVINVIATDCPLIAADARATGISFNAGVVAATLNVGWVQAVNT